MVPRENFQVEFMYRAYQVLTCLSLPDSDPTGDGILLFVQRDRSVVCKVSTHKDRTDSHLRSSRCSTGDHLAIDNIEAFRTNRQNLRPGRLSNGLRGHFITTTKPINHLLRKVHHLRSTPGIHSGRNLSGECPRMNTLEQSLPIVRGLCFERGNLARDRVELDSRRGVVRVHCLDVIEEHGKRDPVVEGVVKDDNEVVFVRRYVTEVDWGAMKRVLNLEIEATDEFIRRVVDRLPLLRSPLEVESGMYNLSPAAELNGEVERCS